jgi:hypothetical protein
MAESPCKECSNDQHCTKTACDCARFSDYFAKEWREVTKKVRKGLQNRNGKNVCDEYGCEWWSRQSGCCTLVFGIDCAKNKFREDKEQ